MRVLMIHNGARSDLPSGEAIVFQEEVAALRAAGVEVEPLLFTPEPAQSSLQRLTIGLRLFGSRSAYRLIRDTIARVRPTIVHAHSILPDLTVSAFAACNDAGIPVVQTLHNYRWLCVEGGLFRDQQFCRRCIDGDPNSGRHFRCVQGSWIASALLTENNRRYVRSKRLFQMVQKFIVVSQFAQQQYLDAGFPAGQVVVKRNGVEAAPNSEIVSRINRRRTICFAGRLDRAKGTALLKQLVVAQPDWHWTVIGSGPEAAEWGALQQAVGTERLELTGSLPHDQVQRRLATAMIAIVPSLVPETFGLVAAEAMAWGTPVVASHAGGLAELLGQSGGGITVRPELGAEAFLAELTKLLANADDWNRCSQSGNHWVQSHLNRQCLTAQLRGIYEEVSR